MSVATITASTTVTDGFRCERDPVGCVNADGSGPGARHHLHVPVPVAFADPRTPEGYLRLAPILDDDAYQALAERPSLSDEVRARVVDLAVHTIGVDGDYPSRLVWALARPDLTTKETTWLAHAVGHTFKTDERGVRAVLSSARGGELEVAAALLDGLQYVPSPFRRVLPELLRLIDEAGWCATVTWEIRKRLWPTPPSEILTGLHQLPPDARTVATALYGTWDRSLDELFDTATRVALHSASETALVK